MDKEEVFTGEDVEYILIFPDYAVEFLRSEIWVRSTVHGLREFAYPASSVEAVKEITKMLARAERKGFFTTMGAVYAITLQPKGQE